MAVSTCGKCGNTSFELVEVAPKRSKYKFYFVQCDHCGVPVAVMDYENIGARLHDLEKHLKSLQHDNLGLNNNLAIIKQGIDRLKR